MWGGREEDQQINKDLLYKVHVFVSLGPRHNQCLPFWTHSIHTLFQKLFNHKASLTKPTVRNKQMTSEPVGLIAQCVENYSVIAIVMGLF